ncbi:hypothetical protein BDP27DRAFT_1327449 [Rhodocollybia butyracea]|uniref:Uncharacterized protein n=1 Tax=Rhodocollybia butyracea TaxID=206335 RepID=A0A9P5PRZ1_9AGAR|nr:hypothetical protein BDP27DRAFT_1327449 [Rhodocollybia butyracea]
MRTLPRSSKIFRSYLFLILWLTLYIYWFNLSNQITGVEEDRINKPDRPIPARKVTIPALWPETVCWVLMVALLCGTPLGKHWFFKNFVAMTISTWALLGASWKAIAPLTTRAEHFNLAISCWAGLLISISDLRDIRGDAAIGRRTLPLVVGTSEFRWMNTLFFIPISLMVLWGSGILSIAPVSLVAVHTFLGYRVMQDKGSYYDHKTYMVLTYTFCLVLATTALEGLDWNGNVTLGVEWLLGTL